MRDPQRMRRAALGALALVWACSSDDGPPGVDDGPETGPPSRALAAWTPGAGDTCTQETHNRYSTVGPDGKLYPTWHPPVDPATGCSFGHDHGRDPSGSDLRDWVGKIPFGYANEQLDIYDPSSPRHEDHVGHKVEWANDIELDVRGPASGIIRIRCDVLTKLHQGTHSRDAFTNNLHEVVYAIDCGDGMKVHYTALTAIGRPGEFRESCTGTFIQAGTASPASSPSGGGFRSLPTRTCIEQIKVGEGQNSNYFALNENWETDLFLQREGGGRLFSANPYFQVRNASRFFDPAVAGNVGRPIAACDEVNGGLRLRGGYCRESTNDGALQGLAFDDPRSAFDGARRVVDVNGNRIRNAGGPEVWYSDPYGRNARTEPFPGSLRQRLSSVDNDIGVDVNGPVIGNRDYGGRGVHAPN